MKAARMQSYRSRTFKNVLFGTILVLSLYVIFIVTTPGKFTKWSPWSSCSVSCGGGFITRNRSCTAPAPGHLGCPCKGHSFERRKCNEIHCPQNGGYSEWGKFGNCDKACGGGKRIRKRSCNNPEPKYGGSLCDHLGAAEESQICNKKSCPINGRYTNWGKYSDCKMQPGKSCGKGKKIRTRKCSNPAPQHGGKACQGPDKQTVDCEIPCPTQKPTISPSTATNITN